ncbi:MAG TPA: galactokinase family protein, partial [Deinococcales bacterium]|nr:galactokinase family protein [Deinococcales bacterium]
MNDSFQRLFGRPAQHEASAPGRVNLIGEHTDYNDGFVLPTAIPQRTTIRFAPREDGVVRAHADEMGETFEYRLGEETPGRGWLDYVQGITSVLASEGMHVTGFDATIHSDVPVGSGLSSSAALLVALLRGLREVHSLPIDDVRIAVLARQAENGFVGAHVGIMDQMACSLADEHRALFLDTQSMQFDRVPLPQGAELVVLNSGVE